MGKSEENYNYLVKHLYSNSIYLDKQKFKAILFTINLMTNTNMTKANCIKLANKKFKDVTKSYINEFMKGTDVISNSYYKSSRYTTPGDHTLNNQFKNRIERDNQESVEASTNEIQEVKVIPENH